MQANLALHVRLSIRCRSRHSCLLEVMLLPQDLQVLVSNRTVELLVVRAQAQLTAPGA